MNIAVYTCITGNYDRLSRVFPMQNQNIDFICFTDNPQLSFNCGNWNIKQIPNELRNLSPVKQQRIIKACPHKYLPEYGVSLWIDGNIEIISGVFGFITRYDLTNTTIYTKVHPSRDCIYKEADTVVKMKKDVLANVKPQISRYRTEGFPNGFGLHETSVILRRHGDQRCQIFGNRWAKEIMDGSHRDQLSFDYCRWKLGMNVGRLQIGNLLKDKNFRWRPHGK